MEDTTPDFQDLLAAFDIPDMTVKISEVRSLAPVSTSDLCQTKPTVTEATAPATVKQEPDVEVNDQLPSWKPDEQGDCDSQPDKKVSDFGDLNIGQENDGVCPASTAEAVDTLNESLTNKKQVLDGYATSTVPSVQHARVVSSTLMANSWANTGPPPPPTTAVTSPTTSTASVKPATLNVDKPLVVPTSLIKFSNPISPGSSGIRLPNTFTTAITASVYVNWVNTTRQSLTVPPLIVGSSPSRPVQSKITSILVSPPTVNDRTPRPATSTNNTTLVFSTYKVQQISPADILKRANPIPRLHPSSSNIQSKIEFEGRVQTFYPCNECGDTFMIQSSLLMHMERRSVQISYSCPFCMNRRRLMFYNKCSFFAHLHQHCEQMKLSINYITQACNASVSPFQHSQRKLGTTHNKTSDDKSGASSQNTSTFPGKAATGTIETKTTGTLKIDTYHCPECNINLTSECNAQFHMQRLDTRLVCEYCKMALPNKCQLNAHSIMHTGCPKGMWTCPECARQLSSYQMLSHHIANYCMHWYHQIRTKCTLCARMVPNYLQHLDKGHEMLFYRCVSCSMAFKSLPSLKEHSEQKHQIQPGSPLCRIISKCPLCETVFMQKPLLVSHIKAHIDEMKSTTYQALIFSCPKCMALMGSLPQFKKHLKTAHLNNKHCFCDFCRKNVLTYDNLKIHLGYQGSEACYKKARVRSILYTNDPPDPKPPAVSQASNNEKSEEQPLEKLYVKKTRICPVCQKDGKSVRFRKEEDLKSHMSAAHPSMKLSSIDSAECVKYTTIKETEDLGDEKSSSKAEKSRKRKGSQETADEEPPSKSSTTSKSSTKKPKFTLPSLFICAKSECHFQSCDRGIFKTHIERHRKEASLLQCEECGMCFRVEASIKRHLFIQHMIKEYDAYMKLLRGTHTPSPPPTENNTNHSPEDVNKTPTSSSTSSPMLQDKGISLECQVCYKTFQNESTLRTHMRNHGMAFIRSKRSTSSD